MSNVINIFDFKKKQAKENNNQSDYNMAEIMKKNAKNEKRIARERAQANAEITESL